MSFFRRVSFGSVRPRFHGLVYVKPHLMVAMVCPIPFCWIARPVYVLYMHIAYPVARLTLREKLALSMQEAKTAQDGNRMLRRENADLRKRFNELTATIAGVGSHDR